MVVWQKQRAYCGQPRDVSVDRNTEFLASYTGTCDIVFLNSRFWTKSMLRLTSARSKRSATTPGARQMSTRLPLRFLAPFVDGVAAAAMKRTAGDAGCYEGRCRPSDAHRGWNSRRLTDPPPARVPAGQRS